ncbi:MAG: hypothetical protein ACREAC_31440, partial [Blastocatellia bacterium]
SCPTSARRVSINWSASDRYSLISALSSIVDLRPDACRKAPRTERAPQTETESRDYTIKWADWSLFLTGLYLTECVILAPVHIHPWPSGFDVLQIARPLFAAVLSMC